MEKDNAEIDYTCINAPPPRFSLFSVLPANNNVGGEGSAQILGDVLIQNTTNPTNGWVGSYSSFPSTHISLRY